MRPIIQLHTIEQWFSVDPAVRSLVLQNIKLKDRLSRYLISLNGRQIQPLDEPKYVPCRKCEKTGWVLMEPRYPGIHPSQIAHLCLLKIYNEMIGKPGTEQISPRLQMIFDVGHAVHKMFQNYGLDGAWGSVYRPEVRINGELQKLAHELMLEGSADAENVLVIDDIPGIDAIYEVGLVHEYKTINSNAFEKLARPKPEHQQQALLYSAALNRPVVVYLYFSKNDSNLADFPVAFDPNRWAVLEEKAKGLVESYHRNETPSATVGFHCENCGYKKDCEPYRFSLTQLRTDNGNRKPRTPSTG